MKPDISDLTVAKSHRIAAQFNNPNHRLVFVLSRFGGLRIPSEVITLRWEHVDWKRSVITVTCRKFNNTGEIPLTQDLKRHLLPAFKSRLPDVERVVPEDLSCHRFRRALDAAFRSAGLVPPPRHMVHSLRAEFLNSLAL